MHIHLNHGLVESNWVKGQFSALERKKKREIKKQQQSSQLHVNVQMNPGSFVGAIWRRAVQGLLRTSTFKHAKQKLQFDGSSEKHLSFNGRHESWRKMKEPGDWPEPAE